ncbi:hypothetical protein [Halorussus halophilus]|uniref:hypothetical protein n=1 Tax=Halorussus halophilus TaxID=2650975 RepID=UPI001300FF96|nr:hypothetical protein [Halorussus halophilus]
MTDTSTRNADDEPTHDPLFDPETLRGREDVEFTEATRVHDDEDHCSVDIEGKAVVGVTDDEGKLLLIVDDEREFATPPGGNVESGDDWAAVGKERTEHLFELPIELDGPRRVRKVEHVTEGDNDPHATSYEVVFEASPVANPDGATDGCDWRAEWVESFPEVAGNDGGPAEADARLFVDD